MICELCGGKADTYRNNGPFAGAGYCRACSDTVGAIPSYRYPIDAAIAKKRGLPIPPAPTTPYPARPGETQLDYCRRVMGESRRG